MKSILLAFQFLTVIPISIKTQLSERDMGKSAAFFPFVGAWIGCLLYLSYKLLSAYFPAELSTALVLVLLIGINKGFHLDGLADTFDAIAPPINDTEKRLAIMKDSVSGPAGVTAIVATLLVKFVALKTLANCHEMFLLMPVVGRWAMTTAIYKATPARQSGLGKTFIAYMGLKEWLIATGFTAGMLLAFLNVLQTAIHLLIISLLIMGLRAYFTRKFSGLTGDTLGAMCELCEVAFLLIQSIHR